MDKREEGYAPRAVWQHHKTGSPLESTAVNPSSLQSSNRGGFRASSESCRGSLSNNQNLDFIPSRHKVQSLAALWACKLYPVSIWVTCRDESAEKQTNTTAPEDKQAAKPSDWQPCRQAAIKELISSEAAAQEQACEAIAVVFSKCGQGADCQLWAQKGRQREVEGRCTDGAETGLRAKIRGEIKRRESERIPGKTGANLTICEIFNVPLRTGCKIEFNTMIEKCSTNVISNLYSLDFQKAYMYLCSADESR